MLMLVVNPVGSGVKVCSGVQSRAWVAITEYSRLIYGEQ